MALAILDRLVHELLKRDFVVTVLITLCTDRLVPIIFVAYRNLDVIRGDIRDEGLMKQQTKDMILLCGLLYSSWIR